MASLSSLLCSRLSLSVDQPPSSPPVSFQYRARRYTMEGQLVEEGQQHVMASQEIMEDAEQHELAIEQQPANVVVKANVVVNSDEEEAIGGRWNTMAQNDALACHSDHSIERTRAGLEPDCCIFWTEIHAGEFLKLEHIAISERRSQAKLLGMVMVITGASHISGRNVVSHRLTENWIRGPLLVSFSVLFSVLYNILMEMTTKKTDALPLFLTASICTLGALMNLIVAVAMESGSGFVWIVGLNTKLVCYLYSYSGALIIVTGLFILQWGKLKAGASEDG
ncbi:nodulin MtN21 /EamA-like transporter family protein [Prunus dulcis]|uniref:Nodulin MtN21 /EamA-like transporter family protein n=1 Tax=Prunus dulcis TaxID=3755 RepID=A0A4Y1RE70_PRUDU|nr:nodulin MtN21 /EamA-like transporter family protein [Prunus dulcis]